MPFYNSFSSAEKRAVMNPNDLRFTQPDIKSTFKDATHPSVRDTSSLLRRGQLSSDAFGELHVSTDKDGVTWCDNNRRLFASRDAGVESVPVVFDGNRRPKNAVKSRLKDPDFMPRIRGEASGVQTPPPPTSGSNFYQQEKETSLTDDYLGWYHQDNEDEDDYEDEDEDNEDEDDCEDEGDEEGDEDNEDDDNNCQDEDNGDNEDEDDCQDNEDNGENEDEDEEDEDNGEEDDYEDEDDYY